MTESSDSRDQTPLAAAGERALAGGAERYHRSNADKGKLFVRQRIDLLVDAGTFVEDGRFPWNQDRRATLADVSRLGDVVLLCYALSDRYED